MLECKKDMYVVIVSFYYFELYRLFLIISSAVGTLRGRQRLLLMTLHCLEKSNSQLYFCGHVQ